MSDDNMFSNTFQTLKELESGYEYSTQIELDEEGYIDKECPNKDCLSKFKVLAKDWEDKFSNDAVYCPYCGIKATSDQWYTTEQIEQTNEQAMNSVEAMLDEALTEDIKDINMHQPKNSIFQLKMTYKGATHFVDMPVLALDVMKQKVTCEKCGAHYEVVGSAFYCPCCGNNSVRHMFGNSINKVKACVNNIDDIKASISDKDDAERICDALRESSVSNLVTAFQKLNETIFKELSPDKKINTNVFQRLKDGNLLWHNLVGKGYDDWLTLEQMKKLKVCFQKRHLLEHQDGIVDSEYITKSGDNSYRKEQRITITGSEILEYANIVEKIGNEIMQLTSKSIISK